MPAAERRASAETKPSVLLAAVEGQIVAGGVANGRHLAGGHRRRSQRLTLDGLTTETLRQVQSDKGTGWHNTGSPLSAQLVGFHDGGVFGKHVWGLPNRGGVRKSHFWGVLPRRRQVGRTGRTNQRLTESRLASPSK